MSKSRGSSCGTTKARVCTVIFIFTWVLLLVPLAMTHLAIADLIPVLQDLSKNVKKGFYEELKFDRLETDSIDVRDASEAALVLCEATAAQCTGGMKWDENWCQLNAANRAKCTGNWTQDQTTNYNKIQAAFASSLTVIERVAGDKYFGQGGLQDTQASLEDIVNQTKLLATEDSCLITNNAYCVIYQASVELVAGSKTATDEIDKLIDNDMVKSFNDYSDNLVALHGLPYVTVISMLFFTCFWWKDAACMCCGGSFLGAVGMALHWLFWLASCVVCIIIVAIGYVFVEKKDEIKLEGGTFAGDPTLEELLDHISLTYPNFWAIVITPLEGPLKSLYDSFWLFLFFCILIFLYGCCVCICKPYKTKAEVQVQAS